MQTQGGAKEITMEFYNMALDHFIRILASAAHVTIMRDQSVGEVNITVVSPERVSLDVAFQILNSLLQARDYALVQEGPSLYKIQQIARAARSAGVPIQQGADPNEVPPSSDLITQVIPLQNLSAQEVSGEIASVLSQNVTITNVPSTNSLIVTDTAGSINRALQVIQLLEGELSGGIKAIHLRYRDASEVASLIQSLVLNRGGGGGPVGGPVQRPVWERGVVGGPNQPGRPNVGVAAQTQIATSGGEFVYADTRTNTLLVKAIPLHLKQIEDLIEGLDVRVDLTDSVYVYPVQNLSARDLANLVGPCVGAKVTVVEPDSGGGATGRQGTTGGGSLRGRNQGSFRGGGGGGGGYNYQNRNYGISSYQSPSVEVDPTAAPTPEARSPLQIAQGEPPAISVQPAPPVPIEGGVPPIGGGEDVYSSGGVGVEPTITADPTANTLLIMAPPEQLEMIKAMLGQLDVMPPQVYIQAVIAEIGLTDENSLGFQWQHIVGQFTWQGKQFTSAYGTNFGLAPEASSDAPGLAAVIFGPNSFKGIINALSTNANAKILSTPSIFTSNNEAASIVVASQRPFPTSQIQNVSGEASVISSVDWQSVGVTLTVTPRVTQGNVVKMDVQVTADQPGEVIRLGSQDYPTSEQRQAQATVSVKDGNTVVLGGLMGDTVRDSYSGVPLLSKLPLLGALFRNKKTIRQKAELLVFLTPRVVRSAEEAQCLSESERDKLTTVPQSLSRPFDKQGLENTEQRRRLEKGNFSFDPKPPVR